MPVMIKILTIFVGGLTAAVRLAAAMVLVLLAAAGCVSFPDAPMATTTPKVVDGAIVSMDGVALATEVWAAEAPRAIIIAVHGMNDYSHAFAGPGAWWAENASITTYAFDQRGFGNTPEFGRWAGGDTMRADLRAAVGAVRRRHPETPVYVLGHSMGAAVAMAAEADAPLGADGLVLAAPGVWGGGQMPIFYRATLNLAAAFAPGKTLTGERAARQATDNIEILRAMNADPLVIKETRLDAILGVVRVMGKGAKEAGGVTADVLYLIGEKDEIIPLDALEKTYRKLENAELRRYPDGWHLLFRDLQAERVWRDIADWIIEREDAAVITTVAKG